MPYHIRSQIYEVGISSQSKSALVTHFISAPNSHLPTSNTDSPLKLGSPVFCRPVPAEIQHIGNNIQFAYIIYLFLIYYNYTTKMCQTCYIYKQRLCIRNPKARQFRRLMVFSIKNTVAILPKKYSYGIFLIPYIGVYPAIP